LPAVEALKELACGLTQSPLRDAQYMGPLFLFYIWHAGHGNGRGEYRMEVKFKSLMMSTKPLKEVNIAAQHCSSSRHRVAGACQPEFRTGIM
jgi:hypothetical protein